MRSSSIWGAKGDRDTQALTIYHPETVEESTRSKSKRKIVCRKRESNAQVCTPGHRSSWQMGREEEGTLAANSPAIPPTALFLSLPSGSPIFLYRYNTRTEPETGEDLRSWVLRSASRGAGSYRSSTNLPSGPSKYLSMTSKTLQTREIKKSKGCLVPTTIHDI